MNRAHKITAMKLSDAEVRGMTRRGSHLAIFSGARSRAPWLKLQRRHSACRLLGSSPPPFARAFRCPSVNGLSRVGASPLDSTASSRSQHRSSSATVRMTTWSQGVLRTARPCGWTPALHAWPETGRHRLLDVSDEGACCELGASSTSTRASRGARTSASTFRQLFTNGRKRDE
jgi:hypothetical protein